MRRRTRRRRTAAALARPRRSRRPLGAVVGVGLLLLGGCGPADAGGDAAAPSDPVSAPVDAPAAPGTAPPAAPTSADDVRRSGHPVALGDVTVHVADGPGATPPVETAPPADAAVTLVVPSGPDPGSASDGPALLLAGPPGSTAEVLGDGTAVLRDADATVLAGVVPRGTRLRAGGDGLVEVTSRATGTAADGAVVVGGGAVVSADWADRGDEGGLSLVVVPRDWVRTAGEAGVEAVWSALAARTDLGADAVAPGMRDQLGCHALGAPDKASWNLEPWRPDVGFVATLTARCNPA